MSRHGQREQDAERIPRALLVGFLAAGCLGLAGCTSAPLRLDVPPRETKLAAARVELPASFADGRPHVDLMVNGTGPYRFVVDTGAEATTLTVTVAHEAGLRRSQNSLANVVGSGGQSELQAMALVPRIEAAGMTLVGVPVTVMRTEKMATLLRAGERPTGGILGLSALRDLRLEIDYAAKKVSVARLDTEPPPSAAGITYEEVRPRVLLATPSSLHPTVRAVIDTGAEDAFGLVDLDSYPHLQAWTKADEYSFGIGGHWRPLLGQIKGDLQLGTIRWRDARAGSARSDRIGSAALSSLKLVVDQRLHRLWLLEPNQIVVTEWPTPRERDGRPAVYGYVLLQQADAFIIKEVDPGSRAERAGLRSGDRVLGRTIGDEARAEGEPADPYRTRLRLSRGGVEVDVVLSLSDPLPDERTGGR